MSEETITRTPPPVPHRPALDLTAADPVPRIRLIAARGVERVRERSRHMLAELVDEMLQDGPPADLTEVVLSPFTVGVTCELMGVPATDRQGVHTWTRLILSAPHGTGSGERARKEMDAYFSELICLRRDGTGEDVTSLLAAAVGRGEVTPEEAVRLAVLLQTGGETVMGAGGRLFHVLLTHPELAERLRAEPEIRPRAVHALLRRPGTADLLGSMLARLEAELLVDALLDGVPGLRLAVPAEEVPLGKGPLSRGPQTLPVTW
ncbi:hypothetical protein GCM10023086_71480 [Streptomyces venetus]|uniref:Cytochrome P450 n=1 Tax=Streptomyces venetus TaxID=1701086 RepID=A0ABP8HD12_9ACTN